MPKLPCDDAPILHHASSISGAGTINGGTSNNNLQSKTGAGTLSGGVSNDQLVYTASSQLFSDKTFINNLVGDTGSITFAITNRSSFPDRISGIQTFNSYGTTNQGLLNKARSVAPQWI